MAVLIVTRPSHQAMVATPVISLASGTYATAQTTYITCATVGSSIYYTLDGSTPTTASTLYTAGITISQNTVLSAIAAASGQQNSAVASKTYGIYAATPTISPAAGTYSGTQSITITDATGGAAIHYTLDGSTPTNASALYAGAIALNASATVKAIAIESGYTSSLVASAAYTITISSGLSFKVSGTRFVNGAGTQIYLQGANFSGLETACVQQNPPWYGNTPNWALAATWKLNIVRIPLTAASWLGLECLTVNSGGTGWVSTSGQNANGGYNYIAAVDAAIVAAQAQGFYVILDLHWCAPQFTFGGVTGNCMPFAQAAFMDTVTCQPFWQSIATRYGTQAVPQPGISNFGISFEIFNEPFLDYVSGLGNNSTTWNLMKNGGTVSNWRSNGNPTEVNQSYQSYGYQQALNDIRAIGAHNPLGFGGLGYCKNLGGYATWMPTDTISPAQIYVTMHPYSYGVAYPYAGGNVYPVTGDAPSGPSSWGTYALEAIASGYPLMFTEDGGYFNTGYTTEPHVAYDINWAAANGVAGYVPWSWCTGGGGAESTSGEYFLIYASNNAPTPGQGTVVFSNFTTGQLPTAAMAVYNPAAGAYTGTQLVDLTTSTPNATIYYTTDGTTPTTSSSSFTGEYITVPHSEYIKTLVVAIGYQNSLIGSQFYTITSGSVPATPTGLQMLLQGQTSAQATTSAPTPTSPNYLSLSWTASSGATSYNIYRATSPTGSFTLYASGVTGTTWADTNATACVGSTAGSGPIFYPANTYVYQVAAVNSSGASGPSTSHVFNWCVNPTGAIPNAGNGIGQDLTGSGSTVTYGATNPWNANPCVKIIQPTNGYWLPVSGNDLTLWNFWTGAFANGYMYIDIGITAALGVSAYFEITFLRVGDVNLYNSGGSLNWVVLTSYATTAISSNGWTTYKIPVSTLLTDYGNPAYSGGPVLQSAMYKFNLNCQNEALTYYVNNIIWKPS